MFWINFNLIAYHSQTDFLSYFLTQKVSIFYDFHQGLGKDTSNASHIDCFKLVVSSSTPHEKNKKTFYPILTKRLGESIKYLSISIQLYCANKRRNFVAMHNLF